MKKHEVKYCPRCNTQFECKLGSVTLCQCSTVKLNGLERNYIFNKYEDCLCAKCLTELKAEFQNSMLQNKIDTLSRKPED